MSICKALWDGFVIHWSGSVFPCCVLCGNDCYESLRLGSLKEKSLTEIYHSDVLRELRRKFASGRPKGLCCAHCAQGELCCSYMDETVGSLASLGEEEILRGFPLMRLEVSLTDHCNMLCVMCSKNMKQENPRGLGRSGFIDTSLLKNALVEFQKLSNGSGILFLHWVGEPTLHPDLPEVLRLASDLGLRIALITNGIRLSPDLSDLVVSLKGSYLVSFSLNAESAETYRIVNNSKQYARVLANIEFLLDRRMRAGRTEELAVATTLVVLKENVEEVAAFRDSWFAKFRQYQADPCLCFNGRGATTASQVNILREAGRFGGSEALFLKAMERLSPAS